MQRQLKLVPHSPHSLFLPVGRWRLYQLMTLSSTSVGSVDLDEAADVVSDKSESARAGCARVMVDAVRWVYLAAVADMSELL